MALFDPEASFMLYAPTNDYPISSSIGALIGN